MDGTMAETFTRKISIRIAAWVSDCVEASLLLPSLAPLTKFLQELHSCDRYISRSPAMVQKKSPVIIIGGGPAGAAAALYLLRKGIIPVIVECDAHPRFHVGESL